MGFDSDFAAAFPDLASEFGETVTIQPVAGPSLTVSAIVESSDELVERDGVQFREFRLDVICSAGDYPTRRVGDRVTWGGRAYQATGREEIDGGSVIVQFGRSEAAQLGDSRTTRRG